MGKVLSTVKAIDVSSHQPADLSQIIAAYRPEHVIVRIYLDLELPDFAHSAAQIQSARDNDCTVGGYIWSYRSADPHGSIDEVIAKCASVGLVLPLLWIDCETYGSGASFDPGPDAHWLTEAVEYADAMYEMKCGIYTGYWWINSHFPGGWMAYQPFLRLPQWWAVYDGNPDIDVFPPKPGLTELAAKQYRGTVIDLNTIRSQYTVYEPAPDPCAGLKEELARLEYENQLLRDENNNFVDRLEKIRELANFD